MAREATKTMRDVLLPEGGILEPEAIPSELSHVILVLDGTDRSAEEFARMVHRWYPDHRVVWRTAVEGAERFLEELEPLLLDLVIADEALANQTERGSQFLGWVAERIPSAKKVLLTDQASLSEVARAIHAGIMDGLILKEWPMEEWQKELDRVFQLLDADPHLRIVRALEDWVNKYPDPDKPCLNSLSGETLTPRQLVQEVARGTRFGRQWEEMIVRRAAESYRRGVSSLPQGSSLEVKDANRGG